VVKDRRQEQLERAAEIIASADVLAVSTGAGISKESGIPTFRDADGLWANFDPERFATREGFLSAPDQVWLWYQERRRRVSQARPNPGHLALADLEPLFEEFYLITQNIDDLHRKAGSRNVIELHGNIFRYRCFDRDHRVDEPPRGDEVPPRCSCGSLLRPDVVWFGEPLPPESLERAYRAIQRCQAMLVVGTSGTVYPAASFPSMAKAAGARVVEVNPERTAITPEADVFLRGKAGELLPRLVQAVRERKEG